MLTWMEGYGCASRICLSHDPVQDLREMLLCTFPCYSSALAFRGPKPSVNASKETALSFRWIHPPVLHDPGWARSMFVNLAGVLVVWKSWKSCYQWGRGLEETVKYKLKATEDCCGEISATPKTGTWVQCQAGPFNLTFYTWLSTGIVTNIFSFLKFRFNMC